MVIEASWQCAPVATLAESPASADQRRQTSFRNGLVPAGPPKWRNPAAGAGRPHVRLNEGDVLTPHLYDTVSRSAPASDYVDARRTRRPLTS